jgi:hypothetical protein
MYMYMFVCENLHTYNIYMYVVPNHFKQTEVTYTTSHIQVF